MQHKPIIVKHRTGEYPIFIGEDLFVADTFAPFIRGDQVCIVTNETVAPLYLQSVQQALADFAVDVVVLPDGEQFKTVQNWSVILDALVEKKHHRDTTLVALGGGVVGDMTGFAAACYQRGVAFIQVPTTLLAQVDASIGGKTAVDHPGGKNLIGAFHQPQAVVIDLKTLSSLPDREFHAGLAEVIKHGVIYDLAFFEYLEHNIAALSSREPEVLYQAIARSCEIKRDVVMQDETEQGLRAILNFGHTFAHAIEQQLGYSYWLHGEAVAMGMQMAADLSHRLGWVDSQCCTRINTLIANAKLPSRLPLHLNPHKLLGAMEADKKIIKQQLRLVLLQRLGHAVITDSVDEKLLAELIAEYAAEND